MVSDAIERFATETGELDDGVGRHVLTIECDQQRSACAPHRDEADFVEVVHHSPRLPTRNAGDLCKPASRDRLLQSDERQQHLAAHPRNDSAQRL